MKAKVKLNIENPPIVGEMAIFWNSCNNYAVCTIFDREENGAYYTMSNIPYINATQFKSVRQFKLLVNN